VTWHADRALLARYAGGSIDEARALSIEAHLLRCPECRSRLAGEAPRLTLNVVWEGILSSVEAPAPPLAERALLRAGVPDHVARLLGATRSLRLSWLIAVAIALGFAGAAARLGGEIALFLIVAPLIPVAGVAAAYGPGVDPTYEVGLAAPMRSFKLLLIRAAAVLVTSTALAGLASLALPRLDWSAAAWLLPSLALTAAGLALSSFTSPGRAFGLVAFVWIASVAAVDLSANASLAAFGPGGQLTFVAVTVLAGVVLFGRREFFDQRRGT
jgi:hypothetical protein